jgi:hypothetical protein
MVFAVSPVTPVGRAVPAAGQMVPAAGQTAPTLDIGNRSWTAPQFFFDQAS